jgi:hypothetical protein
LATSFPSRRSRATSRSRRSAASIMLLLVYT